MVNEKRKYPRVSVSFPLIISPEIVGKTTDISSSGLGFVLQKPLLLTKAKAKIEISPLKSLKTEIKLIWGKNLINNNNFRYGACFVRLKQKNIDFLTQIANNNYEIDDRFKKLTENFEKYLKTVKERFDNFALTIPTKTEQDNFIEKEKDPIFRRFNFYFEKAWNLVRSFDKKKYKLYQKYFQKKIHPYMEEDAEINRHIYTKPLGYAGDYLVMNYIYEYHNRVYLGKTIFEKLINNYTCNISPSISNIVRKEYFKNKILRVSQSFQKPSIASIGAGSVRELIELVKENKIKNDINFMCLDFEKRALNYVKEEINKIHGSSKKLVKIKYLHQNLLDLIRSKEFSEKFDMIYVSGIFDYLKDRSAQKVTQILYDLLNPKGQLLICNISSEFESNRGYYEFLGEWNMIHRTKKEMLFLTKKLIGIAEIKFESPFGFTNYLFLSLKKNDAH